MSRIDNWTDKLNKILDAFFVNCGVLFILLNLRDIYWPSEEKLFGGFGGQLLFAFSIAVVVPLVSQKSVRSREPAMAPDE